MALQDEGSDTSYSPQLIAAAFVKKYYHTLRNLPEDAYRFYCDSSTLGREDSNGNMTSVTTVHDINVQIMSTDYTGYVIELETVDGQASHMGGVFILVIGYFITPDAVKKKFTQSFYLAPQGNSGYFVLNDMFRFVSESTSTVTNELRVNQDNGSTQRATLPTGPETASAHAVTSPSANGVAPVKNDTGVEGVKAVNNDLKKMPEAAPAASETVAPTTSPAEKAAPPAAPAEKAAPPAPAEKAAPPAPAEKASSAPAKDVTKRTYASIVKDMRESRPAPPVESKPSPRPKAAQNAENSVTTPKPDHATNATPPGDKNVSKSKQEPGYSIFVKNLPYDATVEMVEQEFRKFGAIKPGGIQVRNRQADRFCFGFVEFESEHSMQAAIQAYSVYFGSREAYVEEKRTTTRVVNGIATRGDDNGNAGGSQLQSGRGGYQGENFRGRRGEGFANNGNYNDGQNVRNGYRNQNEYSSRGQGQQGNGYHQNASGYYQSRSGYHQNGNGYHQNGNGYHQNGKSYQQRRPVYKGDGTGNGNGRVERAEGPKQTPAAA